jgi:hypothetical protein
MIQNLVATNVPFFLITRENINIIFFFKFELWKSPLKILNLQINENQTWHFFCNFLKTWLVL